LSVNLSPATAASKAFGDLASAVSSDRLVIEITENATVDNYKRFTGAIDHLRSLGVRIALDDAGASDVGLQHLLEIRPDIVKIDTTVIHGIADDELRQAVAIAYASLSKRAAAISLAEGIETEAELAMLSSLGVEAGQGYLLGRPAFLADRV
jgi:EAL domain-containing protein (putative c-di-GMP-specific phosphodiesterase class I)